MASIHDEIAVQRRDLTASDTALAARQNALEVSFQNTRELLDTNRLNRSTRAQALQLFRSGRSADAAAEELGIARREARLLAKVASVLAAAN